MSIPQLKAVVGKCPGHIQSVLPRIDFRVRIGQGSDYTRENKHRGQEELEATQNEVKNSMQSHSDQDLVILVSIGGWIRGTQVVSGSVAANYDERSAKLLRQPALVGFIHAKLNDVSPDLRNDPLVKNVNDQLSNLEKLVTFPTGKSPSPDDVRKVNSVVSDLIQQIQHKPDAK